MQTQRTNRTEPEKILMIGLNMSGWTSIVGTPAFYCTLADISTGDSTQALHGYAMTGHVARNYIARNMSGIWTQAVANNAVGLIQVFGYNNTIHLQRGYGTGPVGGHICIVTGTAATGSTSSLVPFFLSDAAPAAAVDSVPHVIILSATTLGSATNIGLIRCLH